MRHHDLSDGYMNEMIEMPAATPKVRNALLSLLQSSERVIILVKTKWKPSAGIPTLWLAVTDRRIILFSTLATKSVFRNASYGEINSAQSEQSGRIIVVLLTDYELADWRFHLADSVSPELGLRCVDEINSKISDSPRSAAAASAVGAGET
jgi:hypothetical protein